MTALPDHFIPWDGLYNLRDLGGYPTRDGGQTRTGLLFRSEAFFRLAEASQEQLFATLGVKTIIDLRSTEERVAQGYHEVSGERRLLHLPLTDVSTHTGLDRSDPAYLSHVYRWMLTQHPASLTTALTTIFEPANWPLLVHCSAGKDRTGLVAMLILSLAGVEDQDVAADYALTDDAIRRVIAANDPAIDQANWRNLPVAVIAAQPQTAHATLDFLRLSYQSIEHYVQQLGITDHQLVEFRKAFISQTEPTASTRM